MKKLFSFILLSLLLGNVFAQVPTNGLVAYYPFTGNANDNSGNGYDGSVNGAILASDRFGNSDGAYQFDGSSTSIYVYNFPAFFQSGPYAISLWIKSTGVSNSWEDLQHMIAHGDPNQQSAHSFSYAYSYTHAPGLNNTYFNYYDVTNGSYFPNVGGDKGKDKWAHLVIMYDGTKLKHYVNGVLAEELEKSPIALNSGTSLIIGGFPATSQYFNGYLDDIRIYSRSLSSSEVSALFNENCSTAFSTAPAIQFDGTNLTATSYPSASYVWSYNGNEVTGQTSNNFTGTFNAGQYEVTVVKDGCLASTTYTQFTDASNLANGLLVNLPLSGDLNDVSGNNYNGAILDASLSNPTYVSDRFNQTNGAILFSNKQTNGVKIAGQNGQFPLNTSFSVSVWVKTLDEQFNSYVGHGIGGQGVVDQTFFMNYQKSASNANLWAGLYSDDLSHDEPNGNSSEWDHIVTTYERKENGTSVISIYRNNILLAQKTDANLYSGTGALYLGQISFDNVLFPYNRPNAALDDFKVFNRVINTSEINALYTEGCSATFTTAPTIQFDGTNLTATEYAGAQYVWTYNSNVVSGQSTKDFTGTLNAGEYTVTITLGACSASASYTQETDVVNTAKGLELYLPFDGDASDASGNSRDGVVTNGSYVNNRFQKATKSLNLDGNGSGVTFGSYQGYKGDGKGSFTIGTWFKAQPNGETRIISNGMNGNNKGYFIGVGANGTLRFAMGNEFGDGSGNFANSVIFNTQNTSYADNNWHYVVTVVDREQNKITLVVDGAVQPIALFESSGGTIQSDNSVDITGLNISAETSSFLSIGKFESYGYLIGDIDELKIYSRPLNSQEIQSLYTDGCPGFDAPSISYSSSTYCNTGSATPTGSFANGTFSSTEGLVIDATTGVVDLAASTAGEYTVTYTIPAQYGCSAQTATASIEITEVTNTTAVTALCADGTSTKALAGSSNITEWHITPAALASNISNNTFTAPTAAASVSVYATDENGCQSPTVSFEVNGLPTITNTETSVIVGGTLNLTGTDGNTWSISSGNATLVNNVLTAGNAPSTNVVVKYTNDQTGCFVEKSFTINSLYLTADASTYDCGQNPFYVTVQIGSNAVSGIIGGDVILNYDPAVMKPTGNYVIGSVAEGQGSGIVDMNDTGTQILAGISYPDNSSFQGQGDVISFEFKLEPGVVEGEYIMPSGTFTESYAVGYRDLEVKAGKLTVIHFYPTLQGKIQYRENANLPVFNNANPASGVTTVYAAENCVNTGTTASPSATGEFSILMPDKDFTLKITRTIPEGTEVDNTINGFDAVVASRITNGKIASPSVYQLISADVNGDTRILAADKTLILNRAVLNISTFAAGDWKFFPSTNTFTNFDKNNVPSIDACMPVPSKIENGCTAFDVQTYNAVLIGDVNGNYATSPNGANLRAEASATLATLDFSRATQPLTGVFRVPIMVACDSTVYSVDATLDYNSTWVSNARVIAAAVQGSYSMASSVKNSRVRISSAFNDTLKKAEPAMYVEFTTTNIDSVKISYLKVLLNGEIVPSQVNKAARVTSIEEQEAQISNLAVYPNPSASGTFHVDFSSLGKDGASVVVMDLMGKVVYQSNNNLVSSATIDLSAYDSGTYLMKITTGAVTKVKSIVIEK